MSKPLITLTELTTYIPGLATASQTTLNALIATASQMVERFCNRSFWSQDMIERHAVRVPRIYLRQYPVTNIEYVKIASRDLPLLVSSCGYVTSYEPEQTDLTVSYVDTAVEYQCNPANGMIDVKTDVRRYNRAINSSGPFYYYEVSYTAGYNDIPSMVKYAVSMLVESMYSRGRLDPSLKSEKIGDYSYTKTDETPLLSMSSPIAEQLYPFVRHGVNGY